jgi:hypothetical protein
LQTVQQILADLTEIPGVSEYVIFNFEGRLQAEQAFQCDITSKNGLTRRQCTILR